MGGLHHQGHWTSPRAVRRRRQDPSQTRHGALVHGHPGPVGESERKDKTLTTSPGTLDRKSHTQQEAEGEHPIIFGLSLVGGRAENCRAVFNFKNTISDQNKITNGKLRAWNWLWLPGTTAPVIQTLCTNLSPRRTLCSARVTTLTTVSGSPP